MIFTKRKTIEAKKISKLGIIVFTSLIFISLVFIIINFDSSIEVQNAEIAYDAGPHIGILYAIIMGVMPTIIAFPVFRYTNKILTNASLDLVLLIKSSLYVLIIGIFEVLVLSFNWILLSTVFFVALDSYVEVSAHSLIVQVVSEIVYQFMPSVMGVLFFWVPLVFGIYLVKDIFSKRRTSFGLFFLVVNFVLIITSLFLMYVSKQNEVIGSLGTILGSNISFILIAFLSAEGYFIVVKESITQIRDKTKKRSWLKQKIRGLLLFSFILVNITGFAKLLFLILVPIEISPVEQGFVEISQFLALFFAISEDLIATNAEFFFSLFFYGFLAYDFLMLYVGLKEEFLSKDNKIFVFFKNKIGVFSAITIISITLFFMAHGISTTNFVEEEVGHLPKEIQNKYPSLFFPEYEPLLVSFNQISYFLQGLAAVLGTIYIVWKIKYNKRIIRN